MKRRLAVYGFITALLLQPLSAFAIDTTFDIKLPPPASGQGTFFGAKIALGDVNGDGIDDVIAGDPSASPSAVYIYYGRALGPSTTVSKTIEEVEASTQFGGSVATGDVNNDGYDDLIVGARTYSSNTGRAYVFLGGSNMDTVADLTMTGEATNSSFGIAASSGDVNQDGYDDVIIGASNYSSSTGRTYIYFGDATMNNTADVTLTGEGTSGSFGEALSTGDINNDGYDDVVVGAFNYDTEGRAYVFLGGSSMNNAIDVTMDENSGGSQFGRSVASGVDVNNDGYDDVVVGEPRYGGSVGRAYVYLGGSTINNTVDVTMDGENPSDLFGEAVGLTDDVNGDGFGEVLISAMAYPAENYDGRAYLFYGGSSMNNVVDLQFNGPSAGSGLGSSPRAGDVNADATVDFIFGAFQVDGGDGAVYVYLGSDTAKPVISTLSPSDNATGVLANTNLVITFNEIVQGGTGTLVIKKTSDDSTIETITTNGGLMSGSGSKTITINPSVTLADGTSYYITIHPNTFRDSGGRFYAGISAATTWNFETLAASSSSSSVASSSSSSSSQTAEERQGSGGGRGGGSTTRTSESVREAIERRFSITLPSVDTSHDAASNQPQTPAERREQRIQLRKERVKRMQERSEQRKQKRLQRLKNR